MLLIISFRDDDGYGDGDDYDDDDDNNDDFELRRVNTVAIIVFI
jgi:hypothetical protein